MKKVILLLMAIIGVTVGVLGVLFTRFSKNMESWEMSWDDEKEDNAL